MGHTTKISVIKVIVGELPKTCYDCPFPFGGVERPGWQCSIMEMSDTRDKDWTVPDEERPDWCPLYPMSSLFNIFDYLANGGEE